MSEHDRAIVPRRNDAISRALEIGNPRVTRGLVRLDSLADSASRIGTPEAVIGNFGPGRDEPIEDGCRLINEGGWLFPCCLGFDAAGERLLVLDAIGSCFIFNRSYHQLLPTVQRLGYDGKVLIRRVSAWEGNWAMCGTEYMSGQSDVPSMHFIDSIALETDGTILTSRCAVLEADRHDSPHVSIIDDGLIVFGNSLQDHVWRYNVVSNAESSHGLMIQPTGMSIQHNDIVYIVDRFYNSRLRTYMSIDFWIADGARVLPMFETSVDGFIFGLASDGEMIYTIESNAVEWYEVTHKLKPKTGVRFRIAAYLGGAFLGAFEPRLFGEPTFPTRIDATQGRIALAVGSPNFVVAIFSNGAEHEWIKLPSIDGWESDDIRRSRGEWRLSENVRKLFDEEDIED